MEPIAISEGIHWVGAVHWRNRDFHGYTLSPQGTTYNAFVVSDHKTTLLDTVPADLWPRFARSLEQWGDPRQIQYLVLNHLEPDHAGCLERVIDLIHPEKIFCSPMGAKAMETLHRVANWPVEVVKTDDRISIGQRSLRFFEARMLHWPDNMMTLVEPDGALVSSDVFGQNLATSERFCDQLDRGVVARALSEYYGNIILPYSSQAAKFMAAMGEKGLSVQMILPDHGVLFRDGDVAWVWQQYLELAAQKPHRRAVVVYDTMWFSTAQMAEAIAEGLVSMGVPTKVMHLKVDHHSAVMSQLMNAGILAVGSPTHNNGVLPLMGAFLTYLKGLRPRNKVAGFFGSYGWSGESPGIIRQALEDMKLDLVEPGVRVQHRPFDQGLEECRRYGRGLAQALDQKIQAG